jgi:hypothetical protein
MIITLSLCAYLFEQAFQSRYGAVGAVAFGCVSLGHKTRNAKCTAIGVATLFLLLAH